MKSIYFYIIENVRADEKKEGKRFNSSSCDITYCKKNKTKKGKLRQLNNTFISYF